MELFVPCWLDSRRLNPEYSDRAYAEADPKLRARLKTAIAWQFSLTPEASVQETHSVLGPDRAFLTTVTERAANLAIVFLTAEQQAPARLLAAILPAVLAGVPEIFVVCLGGPPSQGNCLALELAGVENIFFLQETGQDQRHIEEWLAELRGTAAVNCLFMGAGQESLTLLQKKFRQLIPTRIWQEPPVSTIGISPGSSVFFRTVLAWAHGANVRQVEFEPGAEQSFSAFYAEQDPGLATAKSCAQVYGPGLEACWKHQDLDLSFFRRKKINACLTDGFNHG